MNSLSITEDAPDLFYKLVLNEVELDLSRQLGDTQSMASRERIITALETERASYGFYPGQKDYEERLKEERIKWYNAFAEKVPIDTPSTNNQKRRLEILSKIRTQYI